MKYYKFESYDDESQTTTTVEFKTESDRWSGYDGPMFKFMDFLRGNGYMFDINSEIGVMTYPKHKEPEFVSSIDRF